MSEIPQLLPTETRTALQNCFAHIRLARATELVQSGRLLEAEAVLVQNGELPHNASELDLLARIAARQGRFWQMHDLLYREQAVWSKSSDARALFNAYAGMLQLDLGRFKNDMDSGEVQRQVELDQQRGASIGVKNTPTIFINNEAVPGTESNPEQLPGLVEAALKKAKPSS